MMVATSFISLWLRVSFSRANMGHVIRDLPRRPFQEGGSIVSGQNR
jgi:hypothetical protein